MFKEHYSIDCCFYFYILSLSFRRGLKFYYWEINSPLLKITGAICSTVAMYERQVIPKGIKTKVASIISIPGIDILEIL